MKRRIAKVTERPSEAVLTIGQLAVLTGVTPETIRFYERDGVIPKSTRRGTGQYRQYSAADADRIRFVRRARDLGFSLDDVRGLLALAEGDRRRRCGDVNEMAKAHLAQVNAKLEQLGALRDELNRLIQNCDADVSIESCTLLGALSSP